MRYVISIYSENIYQEFILPSINNADYSIILPWKQFELPEDITLKMEICDGKWFFCHGNGYKITKNNHSYIGKELCNDDIGIITINNVIKFSLMVRCFEEKYVPYTKFLLPVKGIIKIGSEGTNDIVFDNRQLVSKRHGTIELGAVCKIYDHSKNGIYINHVRIKKEQILQFGDVINIIGLKMMFLGSFLAIDTFSYSPKINTNLLYCLKGGEIVDATIVGAPPKTEKQKKQYFNRIPRNIVTIEEEVFKIEGPPQKDNSKRQPLYLTMGPSLTMAIPMMLGCLLTVMGSGRNSSPMMYTGLITAVGSAILGSVWAYMRLKYDKKQREEAELHRQDAYAKYLEEKENEIKEKYEEERSIFLKRYPATDILCSHLSENIELWNRNMSHEDFMYYRLGTGEIEFSKEISVPEKKFVLHEDELLNRPHEIKKKYKKIKNVPIGVDLQKHSLIGIVGGERKEGAYEIVKNILMQIATVNCYTDVKIALAYDGKKREEKQLFDMFRWLPHTWSVDKKMRYVAEEKNDISEIFYQLTQILRTRAEERKGTLGNICKYKPVYVLVVSDISMLNNELISKYIFEKDQDYGLVTLVLAENFEELPNSCEYVIENSNRKGSFKGIYSVNGESNERTAIKFDYINEAVIDQYARKLSSVEVEEMETGGEIPNAISFFEMYKVNKLEELDVLNRWIKNRTYESMKALIGQKAGGESCYLDVHEKYHGPHGLIAGTTGSGKSETLQTYLLSLAINYSPNDVGFFLIDYKGGGMANLFSGLPHVMGQISNLSGNQVRRAMVSIKSENKRRQRIFNENGVNNINSYTKLIKSGEAKEPVPHLFIIIDEFAELKREEPDFMRELISVAQVGRSLGVHLILATQKPSGTVDDNIWSNSKFRLCLRVQDKQDSNDMLHKADAAYITQAGRGYLQVGNDELYELFQSGWSGALYDESGSDGKVEIVKMYTLNGNAAIVGNRTKMYIQDKALQQWYRTIVKELEELIKDAPETANEITKSKRSCYIIADKLSKALAGKGIECPYNGSNKIRLENIVLLFAEAYQKTTDGKVYYIQNQSIKRNLRLPEMKQRTQLDAVVDYLANLAGNNGYTNKFMLWLPVLPDELYLEQLSGYEENNFHNGIWPKTEQWDLKACMGLCDDPEKQSQITLELDFALNGHHVICGNVGSGKSTFMQTLVYSLAHRYSPEQVNFYLMDFSNNSLKAYEKLAHVGGVMYENDLEEISRCFYMIENMINERKRILKGGNYEQYAQVHGTKFPVIFLMIDQYSNFREKTGNIYEEQLIRLSRDGAAYGIYLVLTAAGFGITEISNNIGKNIKTVICLEMGDKFHYADLLHTMNIQVLPETGKRGRGLARIGDRVLEYQTALALEAKDDYNRIELISRECDRLNASWHGKKAKIVPRIPEKPVIEDLLSLEETKELLSIPYAIPVGYDYKSAQPYFVDLRKTFSYLISGKGKTGKTNFIKLLLLMTEKKENMKLYVADFSGKLAGLADECGAQYINSSQKMYDMFLSWKDTIIERNTIRKEMEKNGFSEEEIYDKITENGQICLYIDNLAEFLQHIYYPENNVQIMSPFVENITEKGSGLGIYYFCAFNVEDMAAYTGLKVCSNLFKGKRGIHLGGNVASQRVMDFNYISYKEQTKTLKPGIGMLPETDGEIVVEKIVIPIV